MASLIMELYFGWSHKNLDSIFESEILIFVDQKDNKKSEFKKIISNDLGEHYFC